jgi:TRAP-type C4-dicarboxylate transport system substrate-binding protein
MARTGHIAGVLGLYASSVGIARIPPELRPRLEAAALEAARRQRAMGAAEDRTATAPLAEQGMRIREIERGAFLGPAEALWQAQARELDAGTWLQAALG